MVRWVRCGFILPRMLDEHVIKRVLSEALAKGGDLAELFVEDRRSTALRLDDSRLEDVSSGVDVGAGIRIISGDRSSYAFTNLLTTEALVDAARAARAGVSEASPGKVSDLRTVEGPTEHSVRIAPESVPMGDKAAALHSADDAARSVGAAVRQVTCSYGDVHQRVLIVASDGRRAEDDRTRTRFVVQVVAARDGEIATGFEAPGHSGGYELLDARPPDQIARAAATKALAMLNARPSPAGEFPVVLAPGTGGVLIHEACGHGLEADTLVKEASVYAKRRGDRMGSKNVTIVDDGTVPNAWGSFGVDDEGTPAQRTVLFDEGVLVGHLSDYQSAKKIGHPPTGNGRRQSYAHTPIVRMTNTNLLPGPDDADEIVRSVKRGVFAATFAGGEVNPATGNFVFGMAEAYMIEKGEIAHPIKGAQLIGNGPQVLGVIDSVAGDFHHWEGVCGKDGQHAPVTNGMPTVLLGRVTVGGTEA
ncbi:MAG: TldD/PmbA family protein [Actinomycetota bacterium]|nr:TldD/PmbA family protein [Actinomycetota bacterium]